MAYTVELLSLIEEYPDAFLEPSETPLGGGKTVKVQDNSENSELMALINEFPEAFSEPELSPETPASTEETETAAENPEASVSSEAITALEAPAGYEYALHQEVTTFGWGKVSFYFRYGQAGLSSIWMTVGKSGTEVQSFCEAISRLTNRLLAVETHTQELVRELRGIRGGESEGLGPHRFLGLVDLLGKALQEAPSQFQAPKVLPSETPEPVSESIANVVAPVQETVEPVSQSTATQSTDEYQWVDLSDSSAIASICPDCGAELQQVNGCSGGACLVCGYSSCS